MKTINKITKTLGGVLVLFLIWHIAAVLLYRRILPTPLITFEALIANRQVIWTHTLYSLTRIGAGVGLALLVSIPMGMAMGYFKTLDKLLAPVTYILAPIPKIVFLPLIMVLMGMGETSRVSLLFLTIAFPITLATRDATRRIPQDLYAPLLAAKRSQSFIFYHVVFLGGLPAVFTALRLSLAVGISVLFISENYGTRIGLGHFIMDSWITLRYPSMFAGILSMGILGVILTALTDLAQKIICPWAKQ